MDASASAQFEQVDSSAIYETRVAGSVGWAGYLLGTGSSLPPFINYDDSLKKYGGSYIFATQRPADLDRDPGGFAERVRTYISKATRNRAVVWLASANPVRFGDFESYGISFINLPPVYQVSGNLNLWFARNAKFYILDQSRIEIDGGALRLSGSALSSPPFIGFSGKGDNPLGIRLAPTSNNRIYAYVPFGGANTGCVTFDGLLDSKQAFVSQGLEQGVRYVINNNATTSPQAAQYAAMTVAALPSQLSIAGAFDLGDPANRAIGREQLEQGYLRSGFAIKGAPALTSEFRTTGGRVVQLTPLGAGSTDTAPALGAGGFAFATSAAKTAAVETGTTYLSLAGHYALGADGSSAGQLAKLMGGLFGSEALSFKAYDVSLPATQNDRLNAIPSKPGYAPVFPFETADLNRPTSGAVAARLTDEHQTSWVTIVSGGGVVDYLAEPEGSAIYAAAEAGAGAEDVAILQSAPPFMPLAQGNDKTFPLVPYGAAASSGLDGATLVQFESQIVAATRKSLISSYGSKTWSARVQAARAHALRGTLPDGPSTDGTTPQGFIIAGDPTTGAYLKVSMAQSIDRDGNTLPFALSAPTQAMQDALQTNQLFLVAVNPEPFGTGAQFANTVNIAGWTMTAAVGAGASATAYRNVVIMKFCSGSLLERVTNANRWTSAEQFSLLPGTPPVTAALSYTGLSQWLQDYIAEAVVRSKGASGPFYENFARIAQDPNWTGVIVLAADLGQRDMPPEIAGLAAGIDFTRFNAHHFGFTVSRVTVDGRSGRITMPPGNSSLFGLIDYEDPRYAMNISNGVAPDVPVAVQMSGEFDFTVLQLQSLFENARLTRFDSHVQLSVAALFGAPVSRLYSRRTPQPFTGIVLKGSYVDQGGRGAYVFEQNTTNVLTSPSNVLPAVAFDRVQFNTIGTQDQGATVASNFLVWGQFDFTALESTIGETLDLLSFGSPPDTPEEALGVGLAFSGLVIGMTYPQATPGAKRFQVATGNLAWNLNGSRMRDTSLFRGFALQLKSFVNATGDQKPSDLGFLPVTSQLNLTELEGPWFGVVYDITLGGPGALASGVGFQSQLLAAWSPVTTGSDAQHAVFIGMSLPGAAPGASLFSIQGVIKVAVGAISILRQPVPTASGRKLPEDGPKWFYCLRIDDIAIKIFGIAKLPPSANIQFFLFGDPDNTGSLGWYAAYVADDNPGCEQSLAFAARKPELQEPST
ncbi:hypothetical protein ACQR1V_18245 [Bradyrhizobium oligotrophicum]|uniref:hypothetical protein n=1 Tax=Bradyrhizobium oligotrophicum TaxID=44255 RepID=UPI003EB6FE94